MQHFYISHRSDSNTEHRKRQKRGRGSEALTGTSATSNRHLLTCWALLAEKQLHSVHTPLAWANSEENNTDRGVERLEGVVQSRACTPQLHSSLSVRGRKLAVVHALAASLMDILQHKWEGK